VAGELFDALPIARRAQSLAGVDAYLRPIIEVACQLPAPLEADPMLTAVKGT
jgi:hypothetical protein